MTHGWTNEELNTDNVIFNMNVACSQDTPFESKGVSLFRVPGIFTK